MRLSDKVLVYLRNIMRFDGMLHLLGSMILFKIFSMMVSIVFAMILAMCFELIKEFYDCKTGGQIDKYNLLYDGIGILFGVLMVKL